ncbi:MAG TPA: P-loop NTPase [Nitrososphaerales archaeon]|nr:P-loop NTPase [Nitrososphaerales archaeon]
MIKRHLKGVGRVVLVLSGKGGVGKSVVSAALAALLARAGKRVGLIDADVYGPSAALLFNSNSLPEEREEGLTPPVVGGVKLMSVDLFASGKPIPLTGHGASQVILELLALTDWGELDFLIVDMPPATGDIMLTLTSVGKGGLEAIVVTMPDVLSTSVAHRVLELLRSGRIQTMGVLENMSRPSGRTGVGGRGPRALAKEFDVKFLGALPYDTGVTEAVDRQDIGALLATGFAKGLGRSVASRLLR